MTLQIAIPALLLAATGRAQSWMQWGRNAQHTGTVSVAGQIPSRILAERIYDPFSKAAQAESGGSLVNHYMAPLTHGRDAYMAFKTGRYVSCDPPGSQRPAPCRTRGLEGQPGPFREFCTLRRRHHFREMRF